MVLTQNVDTDMLNEYIDNSGLKVGYICDTLGLSRQGFDKKRNGITPFRAAEVYVLCDLLGIKDISVKHKIFSPKS